MKSHFQASKFFFVVVSLALFFTQCTPVATAMTTQQKKQYLAQHFKPCEADYPLSTSCRGNPTPINQTTLLNDMKSLLRGCNVTDPKYYNSADFEVYTWAKWFTVDKPGACWLRKCENARALAGSTSYFALNGAKDAMISAVRKDGRGYCAQGKLPLSLKAFVHHYKTNYCRALDTIESILIDIEVNRNQSQLKDMIIALKEIGYDIYEGEGADHIKQCTNRKFAAEFDWGSKPAGAAITGTISQVKVQQSQRRNNGSGSASRTNGSSRRSSKPTSPGSSTNPTNNNKPANKPPTQPTQTYKNGRQIPQNGDGNKAFVGSTILTNGIYRSSFSVAINNCTQMVDPSGRGQNVEIDAKTGNVLKGTTRAMSASERQDCLAGKYESMQNAKMFNKEHADTKDFDKLNNNLGSCTLRSGESTNDKKVFECTKIKIFNKKVKVSPQEGRSVIEFYRKGGFTVTWGIVELLFDDVNNIVPPQDPKQRDKNKKKLPKELQIISSRCVDKGEKIEEQRGGLIWQTSCPVEFKTSEKHVRINPDWNETPPVQIWISDDGTYVVNNGTEEVLENFTEKPDDPTKPETTPEESTGSDGKENGTSTNPDQKTDPEKPGGVSDGTSTTGSADGTNDPNALTGDGGGGGIPVPDTLSNRVKQFFVRWAKDGKKIEYVIGPFKRDLQEEERQMNAVASGEAQHE